MPFPRCIPVTRFLQSPPRRVDGVGEKQEIALKKSQKGVNLFRFASCSVLLRKAPMQPRIITERNETEESGVNYTRFTLILIQRRTSTVIQCSLLTVIVNHVRKV